jgi:hypothetical protein
MLVLFHVIIAISSLAYTASVFLSPSNAKLRVSYGLVATTVASGTYLVISTNAKMLQACITGLSYLGLILLGIIATHYKLAKENKRIN